MSENGALYGELIVAIYEGLNCSLSSSFMVRIDRGTLTNVSDILDLNSLTSNEQ